MPADDRLIVALDVPNLMVASQIADQLGDTVSFYKIGLGMLTGGGLALANELKSQGKRIFLDMKFFDIGATVEKAVAGIAQYDLDFLTVHGDPHVVRAAVAGRGDSNLKILAVTILTSLDRNDLDECLIRAGDVQDLVVERARRALDAGADGVLIRAGLIDQVLADLERRVLCPLLHDVGQALVEGRPLHGFGDHELLVDLPRLLGRRQEG